MQLGITARSVQLACEASCNVLDQVLKAEPVETAAFEPAPLVRLCYVIANSNGEAHVDGAAIPLQYATKANHQLAPTANSALRWDDAYGEHGQPYLLITREVQPGREIFTDYGPWFPYARHDMYVSTRPLQQ